MDAGAHDLARPIAAGLGSRKGCGRKVLREIKDLRFRVIAQKRRAPGSEAPGAIENAEETHIPAEGLPKVQARAHRRSKTHSR